MKIKAIVMVAATAMNSLGVSATEFSVAQDTSMSGVNGSFSERSLTGLTSATLVASTGSALTTSSFYNLAVGTYEINNSDNVSGDKAVLTQPSITAVPEPETAALLGASLVMMGTIARRRNAAQLKD